MLPANITINQNLKLTANIRINKTKCFWCKACVILTLSYSKFWHSHVLSNKIVQKLLGYDIIYLAAHRNFYVAN